MRKIKINKQEFQRLLNKWDKQIHQLQTEWMRKQTTLRTKVYSLIAGLILLGAGGTLIISTIINSMSDGNLSLFGFIQSFVGMVIGFSGYIVAHKGLEGTWL